MDQSASDEVSSCAVGSFLDSRHLRLIDEVARAQSVTRAADRLHVTQSAVSHQLREIEDKVGTPLFLRSGRRMLPTPAGLLLVRAAEKVLEEINGAESAVAAMAQHLGGEFRLCTQCHTGYHWLPPILEDVRRGFPQVDVRIAVEHTMNPIAALLDGKLDLAIVNRVPRDKRLHVQPLFRDEQAVVVHPSHPFATRKFVTPRELGAERLLLYLAFAGRELRREGNPAAGRGRTARRVVRPADRSDHRDGEGAPRGDGAADLVDRSGPHRGYRHGSADHPTRCSSPVERGVAGCSRAFAVPRTVPAAPAAARAGAAAQGCGL